MIDCRFISRLAGSVVVVGALAGCGSPSPTQVDYKSDSKSKEVSLATPPNVLDETTDQRMLPSQGGEVSLSALQQVQKTPMPMGNTVAPLLPEMRIQREGTQSWLVIDHKSPAEVWPQVRRFWQEQGFLLVIDAPDKQVMETDWNETRPQLNQGLIRNTLSKAMGNSYVAAARNKYRTRLEVAPNGGAYVFISEKGMREALTGSNNDISSWEPAPNDPVLETEYLKRLMVALARVDARASSPASGAHTASSTAAKPALPLASNNAAAATGSTTPVAAKSINPALSNSTTATHAIQNASLSASAATVAERPASSTEPAQTSFMLADAYERAWLRVGIALDHANFTVDNRDSDRGLYVVRYVDPKDLSAEEQGFWSQVFHGKKEKVATQYKINVREITPGETRVAVVDNNGNIDTSRSATQIMALLIDQLR